MHNRTEQNFTGNKAPATLWWQKSKPYKYKLEQVPGEARKPPAGAIS